MLPFTTSCISLGAGLVFALTGTSAQAATMVKVELWDQAGDMAMATGMNYAAPRLDAADPTMGIRATPATAPAGVVSFDVTNTSKDKVHEMLVISLADPTRPLPYIASENKVDEGKSGDRGEVSELDPGKSGTLTVALQPGKYLLICNEAGHFAAGMWTTFEVTK